MANTGESGGVSFGAIVAIVEDRCLDDPVYRQQPASLPRPLASPPPPPSSADVGVQTAREMAKDGGVGEACAALGGESMVMIRRRKSRGIRSSSRGSWVLYRLSRPYAFPFISCLERYLCVGNYLAAL